MSDERRHRHPGGFTPDRELNVKAVLATGVALLVATAAGMAISWWLSAALRGHLEGADPGPPTLVEAQMLYEPPSPNLQLDPSDELATARAEEEAILTTYAWTDATESRARVPIERGMQLLLETRPGAEAFDEGLTPAESHGEPSSGMERPQGDPGE
jgi:hypothetical protein